MKVMTAVVAMATFLAVSTAHAQGMVNVNTASKDQLEALPGIGAKIAEAIVRDRDENGSFSSVEDLTRVPGVTPSLLSKLRGTLTADGGSAPLVVEEGKNISGDVVKKVLQRFAAEPSIREVQERVVEYVRANPDALDSWRTRSRVAAIAPELRLEGDVTRDDDQREVTNLEGSSAPIRSVDEQLSLGAGVTARWRLDRLIFEPFEASVSREAVRLANLRDRAVDEVTRRYFERRRLQVDLELSPPTELADRVRKELRLQELTADIDSATGGWFSEKLKAAGRSPY